MKVLKIYQDELARHGHSADPAQLAAVSALDSCAREWTRFKALRSNRFKKLIHHPPVPRSIYLHGAVGRGKSFVMDCFYAAVPLKRKVRLHFHEFMQGVHRELSALQGTANPLDRLALHIAHKYKLVCFDEFCVTDITDAMILQRLLAALFAHGVGLVATSNVRPDDLYLDGLNRERFLPAIAMIKSQFLVIHVDHGIDYRMDCLNDTPTGIQAPETVYHTPLGDRAHAAMQANFDRLARLPDENPTLTIEERTLTALRVAGRLVWFDFKTLCDGPRSPQDYLAIAERFDVVLLSDIPALSPWMSAQARRLTWLVDVLYDRHVRLFLSAAVPAAQLYLGGTDGSHGPHGHVAAEFLRTVSRLHEMQSLRYLMQASGVSNRCHPVSQNALSLSR